MYKTGLLKQRDSLAIRSLLIRKRSNRGKQMNYSRYIYHTALV